MKKICICGHFGENNNFTDGQTVKTQNIYEVLEKQYGLQNIDKIDTYNWKKKPFYFFGDCVKKAKNSENLIILPAQNGVKVFIPLFTFLNKFYKKNVFYAVVGGWLPELLKSNKRLLKRAKQLTKIFVETNKMKQKLNELGLENVEILLNFKNIHPIKENEIEDVDYTQLKVCTFSRVIEEKGIENAINVVNKINEDYKKAIYKLDIYGPIDNGYKEKFDNIMKKQNIFNICYGGVIDSKKSVETIKEYDLLLFPTYYEGEGLAGTIIDAFSAGVPVVASDWRYNKDIIKNGETGFIFKTKNDDEFEKILRDVYLKKYNILDMKKMCLKEAEKYMPDVAIKAITKYIK